jgi:glycosyltransferase involved in cell wall biosynthesis
MPNVRCVRLGIRTLSVPRENTRLHRALFFGKLAPIKGVHLFAGIARACPDIQFTLATSVEPHFESYRIECEQLLRNIPNLSFICKEWIGDEEKDNFFAEADILVLPYVNGHYQSGAASESGVYNIPVVLTDLGPLAEVPNTFGNGVVVKSFDPEDFKMAIEAVFNNYPKYLKGVQKYREAANWGRAAEAYVKFLLG